MKDKEYYIQNGWIGNAMVWWGKNSKGYTTDFRQAGRYSKEKAKSIIKRPEDTAWECDHVDKCIEAHKLVIDGQYLNKRKRLIGKRK